MKSVYVAQARIHNSGDWVTVHRTKAGAISELVVSLNPNDVSEAREALDEDGYWADSEDDPRAELSVHIEDIQE